MRMRMTQFSLAHAHCIFNEGTEILSHMSYHQPSFTYIRSPFHTLILTKNTTHLITWHNTPSDMTWVPFLIYAWRHRNTALWLVGPKPTSFTTYKVWQLILLQTATILEHKVRFIGITKCNRTNIYKFPDRTFQTELNSWSFSSKPSLIPVSGVRGRFLVNGSDLYTMVM